MDAGNVPGFLESASGVLRDCAPVPEGYGPRMTIKLRPALRAQRGWLALLGIGLVLLTGCVAVSSRNVAYVGAPRFGPSDPVQIEILQEEPTRPHDKLGEAVVNASVDPAPTVTKIETLLRREAAKLGADAVYLVHDRVETVGAIATGPYWSQSFSPIQGRLVVAVAIKYK